VPRRALTREAALARRPVAPERLATAPKSLAARQAPGPVAAAWPEVAPKSLRGRQAPNRVAAALRVAALPAAALLVSLVAPVE